MRIKYRKRAKTRVFDICFAMTRPDDDLEPGDLVIEYGRLYRLRYSSGWGKRAAGELTPCEIKPPQPNMIAVLDDGEIYWQEKQA